MDKITVEFDAEKKTIGKIEGTEDVNPIDIAKIFMSISLSALSRINMKAESKIIQPDKKIVGV